MTLLNKKIPTLAVFLILLIPGLIAQNIFDEKNSADYANYLFQAQEYRLSALEYERLHFLNDSNSFYQLRLAQSYRLDQRFQTGISRMNSIFRDAAEMNTSLSSEYAKMLILNRNFREAQSFIESSNALKQGYLYEVSIELLQADWKRATTLIAGYTDINDVMLYDLSKIAKEGENLNYKSPFLAGMFSAVVPGSGKIYTNQWKDGLIALVFVAGNAWQSYRGFQRDGIKSPYGWVFGSLAVGFYSGNIFGSVKAAKKHNIQLDNELIQKTENYLINQF